MLLDQKLIFSETQEVTDSAASTKVLDFKSITKVGRGTPLFLNVYSDGEFTSGTEDLIIRVMSGSTSPGENNKLEQVVSTEDLSEAGLIAKFALPAESLEEFVSLYYYAESALTAGGHLSAFLTLN